MRVIYDLRGRRVSGQRDICLIGGCICIPPDRDWQRKDISGGIILSPVGLMYICQERFAAELSIS